MSVPQKPTYHVNEGGREKVDKTTEAMAAIFLGDPVYTWLLHNVPPHEQKNVLPTIFSTIFKQAALNGGIFIELGDYACSGVLMPPGSRIENPWTLVSAGLFSFLRTLGLGGVKRALFEYGDGTEQQMEKVFSKEERKHHWYVLIMGTAMDSRRQGHAASLMDYMKNRSISDKRPIWLEATTEYSRDLYLKYGFELVGDVVLGRGDVGPDGVAKKNGTGITIWSMFWRPYLHS